MILCSNPGCQTTAGCVCDRVGRLPTPIQFADRSTRPAEPAPEVEVGDGEVVAWADPRDLTAPDPTGPTLVMQRHRNAMFSDPLVRLSILEAERARADAAVAALLEETGCTSLDDLRDKAAIGVSLMERIADLCKPGSRHEHWAPADDPAEIVFDLANEADELRVEVSNLQGAAKMLTSLLSKSKEDQRRALQDRGEAVRVAVEDEHLFWFLYVLNACGKHGASCADDPWEWVGAFCGDFEPTDTFNRAVEMKLAGWSHNSDTDEALTWITDAGKEWLADRARLRADQRAGEGGEA